MPAKLKRCVKQVMSQGKKESSAYAICTASIQGGKAKKAKKKGK
jgi:hypothetical protein